MHSVFVLHIQLQCTQENLFFSVLPIHLTDIQLKSGVVIPESDPQFLLQAQTDCF